MSMIGEDWGGREDKRLRKQKRVINYEENKKMRVWTNRGEGKMRMIILCFKIGIIYCQYFIRRNFRFLRFYGIFDIFYYWSKKKKQNHNQNPSLRIMNCCFPIVPIRILACFRTGSHLIFPDFRLSWFRLCRLLFFQFSDKKVNTYFT